MSTKQTDLYPWTEDMEVSLTSGRSHDVPRFHKVSRLTDTMVIINEQEFRRDTGYAVALLYQGWNIHPVTQEDRDLVNLLDTRAKLVKALDSFRPLFADKATCEALLALLEPKTES